MKIIAKFKHIKHIAALGVIGFCSSCFCSNDLINNHDSYNNNQFKAEEFTKDSRIKTYYYTPNEVYLLILHFGFQSSIEFAKGEQVETISLGETYSWNITPLGNRLFIKPLEKNVRTNMTIITNKRVYQFDIVAKDYDEQQDDLVYAIKFYYPKNLKRQGNGKR